MEIVFGGMAILIFILCALFWGLIYPIWAIVQCANSQRGSTAKTIWIVAMIFIWPLASFVYGLFASRRPVFRWISAIGLFMFVLSLAAYFSVSTRVNRQSMTSYNKTILSNEEIDMRQLLSFERNKLNECLRQLRYESQSTVLEPERRQRAGSLLAGFEDMTADGDFTADEYRRWMKHYEERLSVPPGGSGSRYQI